MCFYFEICSLLYTVVQSFSLLSQSLIFWVQRLKIRMKILTNLLEISDEAACSGSRDVWWLREVLLGVWRCSVVKGDTARGPEMLGG